MTGLPRVGTADPKSTELQPLPSVPRWQPYPQIGGALLCLCPHAPIVESQLFDGFFGGMAPPISRLQGLYASAKTEKRTQALNCGARSIRR